MNMKKKERSGRSGKAIKTILLIFVIAFSVALCAGQMKAQAASQITLKYDDRYTFPSKYKIISIKNIKITSYAVAAGKKTKTKDKNILQKVKGNLYKAAGVGSALVVLQDKQTGVNSKVKVTVRPAKLTLIYLAGQSNMTGISSGTTGYEPGKSIECEEGQVYSTFILNRTKVAPYSRQVTVKDVKSAKSVVAGALGSNKSISGRKLGYPLNALTYAGKGKTGPDSAIAYEWHALTGHKVWIVNTSHPSSSISDWRSGGSYFKAAKAAAVCVNKTYNAEIKAGHYTKGNILCFWLQGEADRKTSLSSFTSCFNNMYNALKNAFKFQKFGIIMERAGRRDMSLGYKDLELTASRFYKYVIASGNLYKDVYIVSDVNSQWVTDDGVKSYFAQAYPGGVYPYPTRKTVTLPATVREVHGDLHYSQIGHNENGLTAAKGMYDIIYNKNIVLKSVSFMEADGATVTSLTMSKGQSTALVCRCQPSVLLGKLTYTVSGGLVSYSGEMLTAGNTAGTAVLNVWYNGRLVGKLNIKVE